ncbi:hypothetical protein [Streptomyces longispororuber]|uniref:hypothetical protein n=1 Tax=Streptomyces longispororuber TaxID=68230 RepID=UPI0037011886
MPFRQTIPQDELRKSLTQDDLETYGTDYQASKGGHFATEPKPVPATPNQDRES